MVFNNLNRKSFLCIPESELITFKALIVEVAAKCCGQVPVGAQTSPAGECQKKAFKLQKEQKTGIVWAGGLQPGLSQKQKPGSRRSSI